MNQRRTRSGVVRQAVLMGLGLALGMSLFWIKDHLALLPPETGRIVLDEESDSKPRRDAPYPAAPFTAEAQDDEVLSEIRGFNLTEPPPVTTPLLTATPSEREIATPQPQPIVHDPAARPLDHHTSPPGSASTDPLAQQVLQQAEHLHQQGRILAALKVLSQAYWKYPHLRTEWYFPLQQLALHVFFEPEPHFFEPHAAADQESIIEVAHQYHLHPLHLARMNHLAELELHPGQRLKILHGPPGVVIEPRLQMLTVHLQGYYIRHYALTSSVELPWGTTRVRQIIGSPLPWDDAATTTQQPRQILLEANWCISDTPQHSPNLVVTLSSEDWLDISQLLIAGSEVLVR